MWHVDRSWRKSLNEHVGDSQSRIEIYHQLHVLLIEQNKVEFHLQLQRFMSNLHDNYSVTMSTSNELMQHIVNSGQVALELVQ